MQLYRRHGVQSIWVVDSVSESIEVVRADGHHTFTADETLTDADLLPGFELAVKSVFPKRRG